MPKNRRGRAHNGEREMVGMFSAFTTFIFGYLAAEGLLARFVHPFHWLAAFVAAAVGYLAVIAWYAYRSRQPN